ncbi:MAG: hypothetical protein HY815_01005 [Candidatus Riflebacteria bacterium]|nr:hypothetical protein [Candidatus Riflebacteria bacterium]
MSSPDRPAPVNPLLPRDSVLLPLSSGQLLVSREYALFCRVPPDEVPAIRETLADGDDGLPLSAALRADLARHGFGGPPRPAAPETPSVQLQLTNECNLACAYCCTN